MCDCHDSPLRMEGPGDIQRLTDPQHSAKEALARPRSLLAFSHGMRTIIRAMDRIRAELKNMFVDWVSNRLMGGVG